MIKIADKAKVGERAFRCLEGEEEGASEEFEEIVEEEEREEEERLLRWIKGEVILEFPEEREVGSQFG